MIAKVLRTLISKWDLMQQRWYEQARADLKRKRRDA